MALEQYAVQLTPEEARATEPTDSQWQKFGA